MTTMLDGKLLADSICDEIRLEVQKLSKKPKLAVILVGNDISSQIYVRNKQKRAEYIGFESVIITLSSSVTEEDILQHIYLLNENYDINAILVQLPLPKGIRQERIIEAIAPIKDCDGFTSYNFGRLALGYTPYVFPCTPRGIIELIEYYNIDIEGKNAVIIGRSNIVGKPIAMLLEQKNATVTIAHSHTKNLKTLTQHAELIISAVGKPNFINSEHIQDGVIIIDVGINRTNNMITGDVDYDDCFNKSSYITPVPGGIGPMTVAMLMKNTLELYKIQNANLI